MGVYCLVTGPRYPTDARIKAHLETLGWLLDAATRNSLFRMSKVTTWEGAPVTSLGGKELEKGTTFEVERILRRIKNLRFYSVEIEGDLTVNYEGEDLLVPAHMVASNIDTHIYGHVYFEVFTYYGKTFRDYFFNKNDDWMEENRSKLLAVLNSLVLNRRFQIIFVEEDVNVLDTMMARFVYYRTIYKFYRDVLDLYSYFARTEYVHKDLRSKLSLTIPQFKSTCDYIYPYRKRFLADVGESAKMFTDSFREYLRKEKRLVVGTKSLLFYDPSFRKEPIVEAFDELLLRLSMAAKEQLQPKDILTKNLTNTLDKLSFEKPVKDRQKKLFDENQSEV